MWPSGQKLLSNVAQAFQFLVATEGPQTAALQAYGGTFTLT